MSSTFYKTEVTPYINSVKYFVVAGLHKNLAEFVTRRMQELNFSTYDVARESRNAITHATVWSVMNGRTKNVKTDTLRGLAKGLQISEDELFAIASGQAPRDKAEFENSEIAALFYDYKSLTKEDQEELRAIWEMLRAEIKRRKRKAG